MKTGNEKRKALGVLCVLAVSLYLTSPVQAAGHGPVFTFATPTNGKGGWALDVGLMGRKGERDSGAMFRSMLSYGVTEDVMVAFSVPFVLGSAPLLPARVTSMMAASPDLEATVAWRFHRRGTNVGTRVESTVYGELIVPGPQKAAGMLGALKKSPGFFTAVATGMASRTHYIWGGVGYGRFGEEAGDRRPDLFVYSLVWGYRPPPLRKEYPHWDWRVFVELSGESAGRVRRVGIEHASTGGKQLFLGPTTLGIYKNYAIEGGIQFPVYRDVRPGHQQENFRAAVNFSYFF